MAETNGRVPLSLGHLITVVSCAAGIITSYAVMNYKVNAQEEKDAELKARVTTVEKSITNGEKDIARIQDNQEDMTEDMQKIQKDVETIQLDQRFIRDTIIQQKQVIDLISKKLDATP